MNGTLHVWAEIQSLQTEIYTSTKTWLENLPAAHKARISQHFGTIPDMDPNPGNNLNGPAWAWWCVAVLPLDTRIQLAMLAMCSYKERLIALRKVLKYLSRRRWLTGVGSWMFQPVHILISLVWAALLLLRILLGLGRRAWRLLMLEWMEGMWSVWVQERLRYQQLFNTGETQLEVFCS